MSGRFWLRIGAISGGLAVAFGAFGAHSLRDKLDAQSLQVFETGVRYQMYHALALLAVGLVVLVRGQSIGRKIAGWGFLIGTILFSGSLYVLAIRKAIPMLMESTKSIPVGMITPFGGVAFIVGWVALAVCSSECPAPSPQEKKD